VRRTVVSRRVAAVAAAVLAVIAMAAPVSAAPPDEGENKTLREKLEAAAKGHVEAQARLDKAQKRQLAFKLEVERLDARLKSLQVQVGAVAAESYRFGRLSAISTLLNSATPDDFLQRAASLDLMAQRDGIALRELTRTFEESQRARAGLDAEVREAAKQVKVLAQRKKDAERALATVGGRPAGGYINPNSPLAKPAARNADGEWPKESCTIDDPTTSGCITPRTLHALNQAKAANFRRYVSCHRSGGSGEHPKGRACDFSAAPGGFENRSATGDDRTYGDNLASFFIKNASRLGVLYVIWYRQIWTPGTGWRSYSGGGSPAADHTNHVHLSMI
jgi:peptidoglycan DL-endopeptidase CwlO